MSYVVTPTYAANKGTGGVVTNIAPMAGATAVSYIHRTGATWLTENIVPGDGAVITGSGAGNDGTYLIVAIPDEETLVVRATLAAEAGVASCQPQNGLHVLTITDEATTDWATIFAQVNEPAFVDRTEVRGSTGADDIFVYAHTFSIINIFATSPSTTTAWESKREVVYCRIQDSGQWQIANEVANVVTREITLGELADPADPLSFRHGSIWIGFNFGGVSSTRHLNVYGSVIWNNSASVAIIPGDGDDLFGSLVIGLFDIGSGSQTLGANWRNVLLSYNSIQRVQLFLDTLGTMENIIMGASAAQGFLLLGTPWVLSGLAISDTRFSPTPFAGLLQDADFRDLQTDVPITDLITILGATSFFRKSYTWNPSVVDPKGVPISGALVSVAKFDELTPTVETPISGSPFTTDANGQINAGAGVALETQLYRDDGFPTTIVEDFSYRVRIEAAGFTLLDTVIKPTSPTAAEMGLRLLEGALEGEDAIA